MHNWNTLAIDDGDLVEPKWPTAHLVQEPEDEYHAKREHYLTSHSFINFVNSPAYYRQVKDGLFSETIPLDAAVFGSALHMALLEPERFEQQYTAAEPPVNPSTDKPYGTGTKAYKEWVASVGQQTLTPEQMQLVNFLCDKARDIYKVEELLADGAAERVARLQGGDAWCGVDIQARFDWINHSTGLVDVKTTRSLGTFDEDSIKYGYHIQQAFYWCVYLLTTGKPLVEQNACEINLIVVEKEPPYRVEVRAYNAATVWLLMQKVMRHMAEFSGCVSSGVWPARQSGKHFINPPTT